MNHKLLKLSLFLFCQMAVACCLGNCLDKDYSYLCCCTDEVSLNTYQCYDLAEDPFYHDVTVDDCSLNIVAVVCHFEWIQVDDIPLSVTPVITLPLRAPPVVG